MFQIRNEEERDYQIVEEITRKEKYTDRPSSYRKAASSLTAITGLSEYVHFHIDMKEIEQAIEKSSVEKDEQVDFFVLQPACQRMTEVFFIKVRHHMEYLLRKADNVFIIIMVFVLHLCRR